MKASDLKVGDIFRKQGFKFKVHSIQNETLKNGNPSLLVSCSMNDGKNVDSFFHFKPQTKIN